MAKKDRAQWGQEKPSDLVAVDFETFYSDEISISKMSSWKYVFHPKAFPYLMSAKAETFEWCGDPEDFEDWHIFNGKTICAHNAAFDGLVWKRMVLDGIVPADIKPNRWVCTADLTAYMRVKRSLASAMLHLYGEKISKQERDLAKGKTARDMKSDGTWDKMVEYGMNDARHCWRIACDHISKWPSNAQYISELNIKAKWAGVLVDVNKIGGPDGILETLKATLFEYGKLIPWYPDEPPTSPIAIRAQGRKDGLKVPSSLAKTDPAAQKFFEENGPKFAWVGAIRSFKQANMVLKKVESLSNMLREDGTFSYECLYFGANTGRFTASTGDRGERRGDDESDKFNLFNLPKKPLQGVDMRGLLIPRRGFRMFKADYSQVEARLVLWLAKDQETLAKIASGYNIYEAMAEKLLGMEDARGLKKRDPMKYAMAKAMTLGCGFGMGWERFMHQAPVLTANDEHPELVFHPDEAEARRVVATYREHNPLVVNYWNRHQTFLLSSTYNSDRQHRVQLASGRWLVYFDPQFALTHDDKTGRDRREVVVKQILGEPHKRMYGAKITENVAQATSFDILCHAWENIADRFEERDDGSRVLWTLYDEFVCEVPEKTAEESAREIAGIMTAAPEWASGLPLEVEWDLLDRYCK